MDHESSRYNKLESILQDRSLEPHHIPLEDLRKITNNFSKERLLGEGGFGKVYKVRLNNIFPVLSKICNQTICRHPVSIREFKQGVLQNGDTIAAKKLTWTMMGIQQRQYENEAHNLMRLRHPNVVQLLGYCSETENELVPHNGKYVYAEKLERLLCLEYLPKGSLRGHLSDESSGLSWGTRYKIIEGICYGLHYLHEEWQVTPIIHMDLKPANILLDDNMVPKIADFGLSRLFGEEKTRTCTTSRDGTLGYMAREYIDKGIITKKLDIFSLGVIIIEIMTGHRDYPYEDETSSEEFIELVLKNWRNRLENAPGYTSQEIDCQQIRRCIQIGLVCVKPDRTKRPTTCQIIKMLHASEDAECSHERETKEGMKKVLTSFVNHVTGARIEQNLPPIYELSFVNNLSDEIFTNREVRAADGGHIKIRMAVRNQQGSDCRLLLSSNQQGLLSANVKIVVLHGDFNANNREGWTSEEFDNHIVRPRDTVGAVLTGKLDVKLKNGEAYLHDITFIDTSSFTRNRKFRLGVKITDHLGEQVQEGITEPFIVSREKRRLWNSESARRSRLRKQQHLDELVQEVARLQAENASVASHVAAVAAHYTRLEQENTVLRARAAEFGDRLRSVNEVLRVVEEFSGVAMDIQDELPDDDPLLRPWQLPCPDAAMFIDATAAHMLHY